MAFFGLIWNKENSKLSSLSSSSSFSSHESDEDKKPLKQMADKSKTKWTQELSTLRKHLQR